MSTTRTSPVPLYLRVADTLRVRIDRGVWRIGDALPSLEALALEFGVARVTARQAVQLLTHEGLLSPERGRGTFVRAEANPRKTVNLQTSLVDLAAMYESTKPVILNIEETDGLPPVAADQGTLGDHYVHMRRLHFTDEQPYCVISLYLLKDVFALAPTQLRAKAVIPLLLRLPGVDLHHAHQTMAIGSADAETAQLLRIAHHAPVALVERLFKRRDGVILYYAEVVYRGDWVRWEVDLKR